MLRDVPGGLWTKVHTTDGVSQAGQAEQAEQAARRWSLSYNPGLEMRPR